MRPNRLIAAVAGAAFASAALVGCSSDDLDKAAEDAKNKGSEALSDAASKGSDAASGAASDAASKGADAASDATDKAGAGSGDASGSAGAEDGAGGGDSATVGLGEFSDDPAARTAAEFFKTRFEAASGAADVSAVEPLATPGRYQGVQQYVAANQGLSGPFTVKVVAVDGQNVDVCVGENGDIPASVTLVDGKVDGHVRGDHTC